MRKMHVSRDEPVHITPRKRILFVLGGLCPGGIERQITDMSLALQQTETWEPSVCCLIGKEGPFLEVLQEHDIPVYECKLVSPRLMTFPLRFARLLRQVGPDIVHSHVTWSIPWQVLGARLAGIRPIVFTQQNEYQCWKSNKWTRLRMIAYYWLSRPFISAYTAITEQVRRSFAEVVLRPRSDFQVIYNSVDVSVFKPAPQRRQRARAEMGIGPGKYVIGTVASLSEQKGHVYLLETARLIAGMEPDIHFVLIGDGDLRRSLEDEARNSGLESVVTFLGHRTDVDKLYHGFDCFVLPSLWEGLGIVLLEAMACGVPIVATHVGGIPEVLDNDRCGMLVPPRDPHTLAEAILAVRRDSRQAKSFAENGRARAVECFSLDAILRQYMAIYEKVLGRHG